MKRILVTGLRGFTGRHLLPELLADGSEVFGLSHDQATPIAGVAQQYMCDLLDRDAVAECITEIAPTHVVHLAARAFVAQSDVDAFYNVNLIGTRNLLAGLSKLDHAPQAVLLASSANIYGNGTQGQIDENVHPNPANDYGVSKAAMELVAAIFAPQLPIIITRPFNYTGRGQSGDFLIPKIVHHIQEKAPYIELGNLDIARDFSDVRSVVAAYVALLDCPAAIGETINICSGEPRTLLEILAAAQEISGHDIDIRVNPAFVRANEIKALWGSREKLDRLVPGIFNIPIEDTLRWMI